MFDIHAAALLGQLNSSAKDNPLDWQLPLVGKLACAAVKAVWALARKQPFARENCTGQQWSMQA